VIGIFDNQWKIRRNTTMKCTGKEQVRKKIEKNRRTSGASGRE